MSAEDNEDDGSPGRREVAYRVFAAEFDDADFSHSESDEERAPNYVITPTGGRVNRVFAVGVLTEVQPAGEDILRARIADPTGTFVVYAGQYQPDAQTFLERAEPPAYVAVTGKARTFQPEDSDVVYTSIRPETLNEVEEATRDRWTVSTARQTLDRVGTMATAMSLEVDGDELTTALRERGVAEGLAAGIPLALEHYGTTSGYLAAARELALSAAELVAGEREEVETLALSPDEGGEADLDALATTADLDEPAGGSTGSETAEPSTAIDTTTPSGTAGGSDSTSETEAADEDVTESDAVTAVESETDTAASTPAASDETGGTEAATDIDDAGSASTATESESAARETDVTDEEIQTGEESTEVGEFDGEFELDDEEREEIKSEFGTEFTSGAEVEEPGEAGIDTPDPEPEAADATGEQDDVGPESDGSATEEPAASEPETSDDEADVDLEDAVMDAMSELDDGDGADRSAVIDRVSDEHGASADAVEDAVQDALMNGRCYEPGDGLLKPI